MTRAAKRDVDRDELRESWEKQAASLGFDARGLAAEAMSNEAGRDLSPEAEREAGAALGAGAGGREDGMSAGATGETGATSGLPTLAAEAVAWAVAHLSEREAVFARTDLLAAALAWNPGAVAVGDIEREVAAREAAGTLHAARLPAPRGCSPPTARSATSARRSR